MHALAPARRRGRSPSGARSAVDGRKQQQKVKGSAWTPWSPASSPCSRRRPRQSLQLTSRARSEGLLPSGTDSLESSNTGSAFWLPFIFVADSLSLARRASLLPREAGRCEREQRRLQGGRSTLRERAPHRPTTCARPAEHRRRKLAKACMPCSASRHSLPDRLAGVLAKGLRCRNLVHQQRGGQRDERRQRGPVVRAGRKGGRRQSWQVAERAAGGAAAAAAQASWWPPTSLLGRTTRLRVTGAGAGCCA